MAVSSAKSEILTCWDKNQESYFDKKKTRRDVDKFPVNFSVVPHIVSPLENIFGYLDFKDLNNCQSVCKIWQNILLEKRSLWIELLEKEKIKKFGSRSENYSSNKIRKTQNEHLIIIFQVISLGFCSRNYCSYLIHPLMANI